ncbi:anthranilate synthase component 2/putative glutamine amidotransferase [Herbihabitans rhizosphaerae]|uniref:Anthranilate synthase component 2/putative glutamine amidotransferase n=1 Tax=Herbihabitans rhizosphaerae TaxID=1872711 RepID=A0A4Q7KJ12_9PSEU|nr:gamma-glutamyl-gamma-aminobutyrate hydrolase family protein [Herbihabitans rhizosphaerae]RZS34938.1 anthranilate synthase component 2/putative glutamine amidotransferase [Herbihabitans rhizosphaerae]
MVSNGSERPVIGVTTYLERARFGLWDTDAAVLHKSYVDCVYAAGGNPVLLSPVGDWRAETIGWLDGLVLAGGADIDPVRYGQLPHPTTGNPSTARDSAELALIDAARRLDLPVLAVCRGAQLLNVALGGTLHQHTPDVVGTVEHLPSLGVFGDVEITVEPGSRLAEIVGESAVVRCHHHQSLDQLGDGLRVTARAADGTVEGVELDGARFCLGVQAHPEQNTDDVRLFAALVRAAGQGGTP